MVAVQHQGLDVFQKLIMNIHIGHVTFFKAWMLESLHVLTVEMKVVMNVAKVLMLYRFRAFYGH